MRGLDDGIGAASLEPGGDVADITLNVANVERGEGGKAGAHGALGDAELVLVYDWERRRVFSPLLDRHSVEGGCGRGGRYWRRRGQGGLSGCGA